MRLRRPLAEEILENGTRIGHPVTRFNEFSGQVKPAAIFDHGSIQNAFIHIRFLREIDTKLIKND